MIALQTHAHVPATAPICSTTTPITASRPTKRSRCSAKCSNGPGTKVVIFSQWLRMHELLVRRLKKRGWDHVLFHGGVPGRKRKELDRPFPRRCRLPASSSHRCRRRRPEPATCQRGGEHGPALEPGGAGAAHRPRASPGPEAAGARASTSSRRAPSRKACSSVLKFKKSLFAGVLDGGEKNIQFGGSRLTKFMETVEASTSSIPTLPPEEREEAIWRRSASSAKRRPPSTMRLQLSSKPAPRC